MRHSLGNPRSLFVLRDQLTTQIGIFIVMANILFEQPWLAGAIGAVLTVITFYGWVQTGNAIAFRTAMGFAIGSILIVFLNLWVVTDTENIRTWLVDAAGELQSNEYDKVLKRISPDHTERVESTADRMKTVQFSVAKITKIHSISIDSKGTTPTADVRMNAFVQAESYGMAGKLPRWVRLTLEKRDKEWLITDFEDRDAQHEFIKSSSISEAFGPSR